ncbi:MAG: polysaccharide deacetylase family protein [Acidimicrobiia bacterium]
MKIHGDSGWEEFPSYLDVVVPRVIEFGESRSLRLTAFVVGQDAALGKNREALEMLGESVHEIGNHSFHHEPWLHLKSRKEVSDEISRADEAITAATGQKAVGFRGPGFSVSEATIRSLHDARYVYDASTLPTWVGPLARAFYLRSTGLPQTEREKRDQLFGKPSEGLRSLKPYTWDLGREESLVEMPVTTMPLLRIPFHATYLFYLARVSPALSKKYFAAAVNLCRFRGIEPSLLFHSLDFLGPEEAPGLEFFPGMDLDGETKRSLLGDYVTILGRHYQLVAMDEHAMSASLTPLAKQDVGSLS